MPNRSLDKGKRAEYRVLMYFVDVGIPGVRNGHQTARHGNRQDRGDIALPGVCVQVKDWTGGRPLASGMLAAVMRETAAQCEAAGAVIPLLIEKRAGHANPGAWWAWLPAGMALCLLGGRHDYADPELPSYPARYLLVDITPALVAFTRLCAGSTAED